MEGSKRYSGIENVLRKDMCYKDMKLSVHIHKHIHFWIYTFLVIGNGRMYQSVEMI